MPKFRISMMLECTPTKDKGFYLVTSLPSKCYCFVEDGEIVKWKGCHGNSFHLFPEYHTRLDGAVDIHLAGSDKAVEFSLSDKKEVVCF
ncbi:hypothetical protein ACFLY7_00385 [Patescibacteria group bacterium]